jgi:hypothetical protein
VKNCAKKLNLSINDLITACLSVSLKRYFKLKGDNDTKDVDIIIPANIRFEHYQSMQKLLIENKLAFVDFNIPLSDSIADSISQTPYATKKLRTAYGMVYATYFSASLALNFLPYYVINQFLNQSTRAFTLAFSNTPGVLKSITMKGSKH